MEPHSTDLIDPDDFPEVPLALLHHLRTAFPEPVIRPGQDREKALFDAGKAEVVRYLSHLVRRDTERRDGPSPP